MLGSSFRVRSLETILIRQLELTDVRQRKSSEQMRGAGLVTLESDYMGAAKRRLNMADG